VGKGEVGFHAMSRAAMSHAAAALLMLSLLFLAGCGEKKEEPANLVEVQTEREANEVLVELVNHNIKDGSKSSVERQRKLVWTVTVPKSQLDPARRILVELNLPREDRGGFEELIANAGLIPTRTDERAKLMRAMAAELERTFQLYDGVIRARVHIVLPDRDALDRESAKNAVGTATVLLKYKSTVPMAFPKPATRPTIPASIGAAIPADIAFDYEPIDRPIPIELVRQMVARGAEGVEPSSVVVAYAPVHVKSYEIAAPITPTIAAVSGPTTRPSSSNDLVLRLGIAAVVFGLSAIVLVFMLVHEKRKNSRSRHA
jgi:type III secretion protein J